MKFTLKIASVLAIAALLTFACQKSAEVNTAMADDLKSSEGTPWIQANANTTQSIGTTPTQVNINELDGAVKMALVGGGVEVEKAGAYFIVAAPQVGLLGPVKKAVNFTCWLKVNGADVDNSNVLLSLEGSYLSSKDVIITQGIVELDAGDVIEVWAAASVDGKVAIEQITPSGQPDVPALIFSAYKIN